MKPLKSKVSITLDEDVIERIKQLAEEDDRSFSQHRRGGYRSASDLMRSLLEEHLRKDR